MPEHSAQSRVLTIKPIMNDSPEKIKRLAQGLFRGIDAKYGGDKKLAFNDL